jgi:hypothetical protein
MPGLEIVGTIAGTAKVPSQSPADQGAEELGMFILGDAADARAYSGMDLGSRWLCRLDGPAMMLPIDWPDGITWKYWPEETGAREMYAKLRAHIHARFPGVEARDARSELPLNAPNAQCETFWQNGNTELFRMFVDHMADLQIACRQTDGIRRWPCYPTALDGPAFVNYFSQPDVLYVAIARGPSGAAQHVLIVFSPKHQPEPVIPQGMPRAEKISDKSTKPFQLRSGFLVAFWGRISGPAVMAPAGQGDPAAALNQYLGNRVAAPLKSNVPGLDERLGAPPAWVIRVEPGDWRAHYYELDPAPGEGYSFVALSKVGAPDFQPASIGNAGGRTFGGLTLERYAMLTLERERILAQYQSNSGPQLAALCQKWGLQVPQNAHGVDIGYAGRIVEWDKAIQADPSLSAQFVAQKNVAMLRYQGIEPNERELAKIAEQQQQTQAHLQAAGKAHQDATKQLFDGACQIIEASRGKSPAEIIELAKSIFTIEMQKAGTPAYGLYKAIEILKQPGYKNNPKFANVDQVTTNLAKAHYQTMKPEDQRQEGSEEKYVKSVIADVYEKNGLKVPGFGGFLSRLVDKL